MDHAEAVSNRAKRTVGKTTIAPAETIHHPPWSAAAVGIGPGGDESLEEFRGKCLQAPANSIRMDAIVWVSAIPATRASRRGKRELVNQKGRQR